MTRLVSFAILIGLVALFGLLSLQVMAAFLLPMLMAGMLVVIFGPLHRAIQRRLQGPAWLAAGLTTIAVLLIVLVPVSFLVVRAGSDAISLVRAPDRLRLDPKVLEGLVATFNDTAGLNVTPDDVNHELRKLAEEWIGPAVARAPVKVGKAIVGLVVMIVAFFYFLAEGPRMLAAVTRLVPLDIRYQWQLLQEFEEISRAVVTATLLAAAVQAILAGIGFAVAGLDNVFLLTLLTFVLSMVPLLGAASVWLPASLYLLFFVQNTWAAVGLMAWGLLVVSTLDNVIKPIVLQGQSKLHPLLALLSVLGGVAALGPIGIFVGPIAVAFLQAALTMLAVEIDSLERSDRAAQASSVKHGEDPTTPPKTTSPPAGVA